MFVLFFSFLHTGYYIFIEVHFWWKFVGGCLDGSNQNSLNPYELSANQTVLEIVTFVKETWWKALHSRWGERYMYRNNYRITWYEIRGADYRLHHSSFSRLSGIWWPLFLCVETHQPAMSGNRVHDDVLGFHHWFWHKHHGRLLYFFSF